MVKRRVVLLLAALLGAVILTGCMEENVTNKNEISTGEDVGKHVHEIDGKQITAAEKTHTWYCVCGESITEDHSYAPLYNGNGHYLLCLCGDRKDFAEHTLENGKCTGCEYQQDPNHKHDFSKFVRADETAHVYVCECENELREPHRLQYEVTAQGHVSHCDCRYISPEAPHNMVDGVCSECGWSAPGHQHVFPGKYESHTLNHHRWYCECGELVEESHNVRFEHRGDKDGHVMLCPCGYESTRIGHEMKNGKCAYCGWEFSESQGLEFEETDGGYCLVGIGKCKDVRIVIPVMHNGKPVVAIGSGAFEGNDRIVSIEIPESVKSIGSSAFAGCTSLKEIHLPEGITVIRDNTFAGCSSLKTITVPESLRTVEMFAFRSCSSLQSFPFETLEFIGMRAFAGCSSLTGEVGLGYAGNDVLVEEYAFSGCSSITELHISVCNLELGAGAFSGCSSLKDIFFSVPFVSSFDMATFENCTALKTMRLDGLRQEWLTILSDSMGYSGEEFGPASWYRNTGDFIIQFVHDNTTMTKAELDALYEYEE